jgi:hypothetical protein
VDPRIERSRALARRPNVRGFKMPVRSPNRWLRWFKRFTRAGEYQIALGFATD